ncbi:enoyl-CoA hydratase/isomerase family protein [Stenotrophomonas maltophilia]|uniref:enoyl-CoA hydratase/isomerase family protein n=1 Tax=Stenotrophomonas maltophilia TaxID=40324 RepID=UPI001F396274|nr:enoyl-CoA hydratase-related protein [Stenotrophomonas maltophilia]MCR1535113.1 enoyl-CoA hydratase-related protein [Stenotrophomonas maltophilia]
MIKSSWAYWSYAPRVREDIDVSKYKNISLEIKNSIGYLSISRPSAMNALNQFTLHEIGDAVEVVRSSPEVRGLIITGEGISFAAGADIHELAGISPLKAEHFAASGQLVYDSIEQLGKPSVAAVNGFALGGGCELALSCTFRIASENASFGQPETKLGIIPGFGGTQRLPRLIGKSRAMDIILTGRKVNAQEARMFGLVNYVVPDDKLVSASEELLNTIFANAPVATGLAMQAINASDSVDLATGLLLERSLFSLCSSTDDVDEGVAAFLARRPPRFSGN